MDQDTTYRLERAAEYLLRSTDELGFAQYELEQINKQALIELVNKRKSLIVELIRILQMLKEELNKE